MEPNNIVTNTTPPWQTPGDCNCGQLGDLRTAVTVLAVMLGTSIATTIAFLLCESKKWMKKEEVPKQTEIDDLKKSNQEYENKWKDWSWEKFFKNPGVRDPGTFPTMRAYVTHDEFMDLMRRGGVAHPKPNTRR